MIVSLIYILYSPSSPLPSQYFVFYYHYRAPSTTEASPRSSLPVPTSTKTPLPFLSSKPSQPAHRPIPVFLPEFLHKFRASNDPPKIVGRRKALLDSCGCVGEDLWSRDSFIQDLKRLQHFIGRISHHIFANFLPILSPSPSTPSPSPLVTSPPISKLYKFCHLPPFPIRPLRQKN